MTKTNVIVVFTQKGKHVHSWEADTSDLEINKMIEAAYCSGYVEEDKPLDYIVYNDELPDGVEEVFLKGSIEPEYLNLDQS